LRLQHVSDRLAQVSGLARQELKKITLDRLFVTAGDAAASDAERLWQSINTKRAFRDIILPVEINGEQRWWLVSGKPILIGNSGFAGYRGVGADITLKKQAEDRLSYLVLHDALTDLPNRVSFQQSLSRAIAELRNDEPFALFCLDLDEFKAVNDTMGHGAGDKLLQAVGKRFSQCLGSGPVLARLAGDEFAVLLRGPRRRIAAPSKR
jgi:PAS domain S-box-containing protein